MNFSEPRAHAVPLFTSSKILPLNMLYVETVSTIMFDVSCLTVPTNISNLFIKANEKHNHETWFSSLRNFYIKRSRLNQNHGSFARFGAKLYNSICDELRHFPKRAYKKHINDMLFSLLEAEDDYVESPILLQKIANYYLRPPRLAPAICGRKWTLCKCTLSIIITCVKVFFRKNVP